MFCPNCGTEILKDALFCSNCGFKVEDFKLNAEPAQPTTPAQPTIEFTPAPEAKPAQPAPAPAVPVQRPAVQNVQPAVQPQNQQFQAVDDNNTLITVIKIFMIIGCVAQGWLIIPLAWCLPMTISVFKSFKTGRPIGMGMKICTLLFVNLIAGVCLLCLKDDRK